MPNYLSPGVYIESVPPSARPIAGVGTSTAALIGVVPDSVSMPNAPGSDSEFLSVAAANEPTLVTSWERFKNTFGDFQSKQEAWTDEDYLAYQQLQHAVYGFFNNGGTRCWVIRSATVSDLADLRNTLASLEAIDEIAIVAVPGVTTKVQQEAILDHCEKMLDRVAILDGILNPESITVDGIKGETRESNFAALYFPWIKVFDPVSGTNVVQPPSGHIAGLYARVDAERGSHKAPANEVLRGVVELERRLSKADQDGLNPSGINAIRNFNGSIKVWGARTLGGDNNGEFKYISTRRYFNFLRESIDEGTQFVVFEPNSPALWERIKRSVSAFLQAQWRDGALFGETPQQAFYVKCDAETNPPEVRAMGQVVTEIGIAITKPAEFVIFRIQQATGN